MPTSIKGEFVALPSIYLIIIFQNENQTAAIEILFLNSAYAANIHKNFVNIYVKATLGVSILKRSVH